MARITVEDCLQNVDNLFQLVLLAAQRARRLANGAEPTVAWENDKPTVRRAARDRRRQHHRRDAARARAAGRSRRCPSSTCQSTFRAPQFGLGD